MKTKTYSLRSKLISIFLFVCTVIFAHTPTDWGDIKNANETNAIAVSHKGNLSGGNKDFIHTVTGLKASEPNVPVTGVVITPSSLTLLPGASSNLTATISPSDATNKVVKWLSGNPGVVLVTNDGMVMAMSEGKAEITATTEDGGYKASCMVTVTSQIPVTGVALSSSSLFLSPGETSTLTATVSPSNAMDKTVTWTSGNTGVATVGSTGVVTAISAGSAQITVTTVDGNYAATCLVTVTTSINTSIPVTGINLSSTNLSLTVGYPETLKATIIPANAPNMAITWSSSDNNIATVDTDGTVTPVSSGSAVITATTQDGGYTASCTIVSYCELLGNSVQDEYISRVTLSTIDNTSGANSGYTNFTDISTDLYRGNTYSITIYPGWSVDTFNEGYVVWIDYNHDQDFDDIGEHVFSSPPTHAKSVTGTFNILTDVLTGTTRMRVAMAYEETPSSPCGTYSYGEIEDYSINIIDSSKVSVTDVYVNFGGLSLISGQTKTLTATVFPTDATNQNVTWFSDNPSVASVNDNGVLTAVSPGTAYITVTTDDGNKKDSSLVTVSVNLALNKTAISSSNENAGLTANYVTDGDYGTRWGSEFSDPQWIYVDLGATYFLTQYKLFWGAAYAESYKVQLSDDASTWFDFYTSNVGEGGTFESLLPTSAARYVRIYCTVPKTEYGYSLYEIEVYGYGPVSSAPTMPASSSKDQSSLSLAWEASTGNVDEAKDYTLNIVTPETTETDGQEYMYVYPNPAGNNLFVEIPGQSNILSAKVFDLTGSVIHIWDNLEGGLDISSLNSGMYILVVKTEKGEWKKKFIKQ